MSVVAVLIVALFVLSIGVTLWRVVTMPIRLARSAQRLSHTLQQRQADKAAGRPVAPVNLLAVAGVALAIGGMIVARATSAILGLGMMVVGMGAILIGSRMARATQNSTGQLGYRQAQSRNPAGGGYGPPYGGPLTQQLPSNGAPIATSTAQPSPRPPQSVSAWPPSATPMRFNSPPGWPVPQGWTPSSDWQPDPSWPAAPPGWRYWLPETSP